MKTKHDFNEIYHKITLQEIKILAMLLYNPNYQSEIKEKDIRNDELTQYIWEYIKKHGYFNGQIPLLLITDKLKESFNKKQLLIDELKKSYYELESELKHNGNAQHFASILESRLKELRELKQKYEILQYINLVVEDIYNAKDKKQISNAISSLQNLERIDYFDLLPSIKGLIDYVFEDNNYILTGIQEIDQSGGIAKGNMISIVADSGMQKTMLSLWWLIKMLEINKDMRGAYFEKEMPATEIAKRILSYLLQIPNNAIKNEETKKLWNENKDKFEILDRLIIVPNTKFENADDIKRIIKKEKINIWVLDYLTHLYPSESKESYDLFLKDQVIKMKNTLNETDSIGIIISQVKHTSNIDTRINKIATIGDMEYGKMLKQNSSYIFSLFYPHYYYNDINPEWLYLIPKKTRDGKLNIISLISKPEICTYYQSDNSYSQNIWIKEYIKKQK